MAQKTLRKAFATCALSGMLTGCYSTTIKLNNEFGMKLYDSSESFYLGGLLPRTKSFSASELCMGKENKLSRVQTITTFMDGFLSGITLGIYSPKTLYAWCKGK